MNFKKIKNLKKKKKSNVITGQCKYELPFMLKEEKHEKLLLFQNEMLIDRFKMTFHYN